MKYIVVYNFNNLLELPDSLDINKTTNVTFVSNFDHALSDNHFQYTDLEQKESLIKDYFKKAAASYYNSSFFSRKEGFSLFVHLRMDLIKILRRYFDFVIWYEKLQESFSGDSEIELILYNADQHMVNLIDDDQITYRYSTSPKKIKISKVRLLLALAGLYFNGFFNLLFRRKRLKEVLAVSQKANFTDFGSSYDHLLEDKYLYTLTEKASDKISRCYDSSIFKATDILNPLKKQLDISFIDLLMKMHLRPSLYKKMARYRKHLLKYTSEENRFIQGFLDSKKPIVIGSYLKFIVYDFLFSKARIKKVILAGEMNSLTNSIVQAANHNHLDTYGIQHGVITDYSIYYNFSSYELSQFNPFPDYLFVWGENERNLLEKPLIEYSKIEPVGNTVFDNVDFESSDRNQAGKVVLTFMTQPQPFEKNRIQSISDFVDIVLAHEREVDAIIKLHPAEVNDYSIYQPYFDKLNNFKLVKNANLYEVLSQTDVLVTCYSSVALDFLAFRRPIVLFDYDNSDLINLTKRNIGYQVKSIEEFREIVERAIQGKLDIQEKSYDVVLNKNFHKIDNSTYKRIAAVLFS